MVSEVNIIDGKASTANVDGAGGFKGAPTPIAEVLGGRAP